MRMWDETLKKFTFILTGFCGAIGLFDLAHPDVSRLIAGGRLSKVSDGGLTRLL